MDAGFRRHDEFIPSPIGHNELAENFNFTEKTTTVGAYRKRRCGGFAAMAISRGLL